MRTALAVCLLVLAPGAMQGRTRAVPSVQPLGHYRVAVHGLYTQFERRGWPSQYWTGDLVRQLDDFDSVVGSTVRAEVERQLTAMSGLGVNTITLELRTTDAGDDFSFPKCEISPPLGFRWPSPSAIETTNLRALFDIVQAHRMKVYLRLASTHMDEPFENSKAWLGPILNAIGNHPALDLILFEGDTHVVDSSGDGVADSCGIPAEPPLWLGAKAKPGTYVKAAIAYAMSLGIDARRLSAEAVVGAYMFDVRSGAGPDAQDRHLWPTLEVMRQIFDELAIPPSKRTYAISMYEHRKCLNVPSFVTPACVDADPHTWADETLRNVFDIVGRGNGARVVAPEIGLNRPASSSWKSEWALESLAALFEKWGVDGGTYWVWIHFSDSEDRDATIEDAVKRRGVAFTYNPVANELIDMSGFHLNAIENASFEDGGTTPDKWTLSGSGTLSRLDLGQAEVPSRGRYALRLTANPAAEAVSTPIAATAGVTYTTTLNLRFDSGANVYVAVRELDADGRVIGESLTRFTSQPATDGFDTFPLRYTTPAGTAAVRIAIGASAPATVDADNLR